MKIVIFNVNFAAKSFKMQTLLPPHVEICQKAAQYWLLLRFRELFFVFLDPILKF
jgi:hypothetical protein